LLKKAQVMKGGDVKFEKRREEGLAGPWDLKGGGSLLFGPCKKKRKKKRIVLFRGKE